MSPIAFLNRLVAALPLLEMLSRMTSSTVLEWIIRLARKLECNDDLIEKLARALISDDSPMPDQLKDSEISLFCMRDALRIANNGNQAA